jgi:hypothetical protein
MSVCILAFVILHANHIFSAPYYTIICGLSGLTYISTLSHKGHDFWKKKLMEVKCVFFLHNFCLKFLIPRRIQKYIIIHAHRYSGKIPFTQNILIQFKFSWQILKKSSNIKYHENSTRGSWIIPCRQTDEWMDRWRN